MAATEAQAQISLQGRTCTRLAKSWPPLTEHSHTAQCQTPLRGDLALDVASHWASQTFSETHCSQGSSRPILPPSPSPSWMSDRFISWLKGSPCLLQSPLPFLFQQAFPLKSLSLLLLFCCLFPRRPTLTAGKCPSQEKCILSLKGYFDSKHRSMIFYSQLKIPKSAKMPKLIWPSMRLFAIYSYSTWVIHFITELLRCLVMGCCPNFWRCDIIYNTCIILTLWNLRKKPELWKISDYKFLIRDYIPVLYKNYSLNKVTGL